MLKMIILSNKNERSKCWAQIDIMLIKMNIALKKKPGIQKSHRNKKHTKQFKVSIMRGMGVLIQEIYIMKKL